jgi:hypothetical protein
MTLTKKQRTLHVPIQGRVKRGQTLMHWPITSSLLKSPVVHLMPQPHTNARFTRKFKNISTPHVAVSQCKPYVTVKGKVITDRQHLFQIARAQKGNSRRPAIGGGKRGPGGQHSGPPPPKKRGGADHRAPAHHVPVPGGFDLTAFAKEAAENAVRAFTEKGMGK